MQAFSWWLRRHEVLFGDGSRPALSEVASRLSEGSRPEDDPEYWPTLHRLVAVGWLDDAIDLLGSHSAWTAALQDQRRDEDLASQVTDSIAV